MESTHKVAQTRTGEDTTRMRKIMNTVMVVGLFAAATLGCKGRPSKADCEGLFEHVWRMETEGQSEAQVTTARQMVESLKPKMVQECVEGMTRDTLDCFMAAKDSKAAKKCETSGQSEGSK